MLLGVILLSRVFHLILPLIQVFPGQAMSFDLPLVYVNPILCRSLLPAFMKCDV